MKRIDLTDEDLSILLEAQDELTKQQQRQQQLNVSLKQTEARSWYIEITADKASKLVNMLHFFCFTANERQRQQAQALQKKLVKNN
jgi:hypothetical protein